MRHSDRVRFLEACYDRIRATLIPEAPPGVTLTIGFPSKKKTGQYPTASECLHEVIESHDEGFGGENALTVNWIETDPVLLLTALATAMIRSGLEPAAKNGKQFQSIAKRIGLCKPWARPEPDGTLQQALRGIWLEVVDELGFEPTAHFVPKPPLPKKPSQSVKIRCQCETPRTLTVHAKQLDRGSLLCGHCQSEFRPMTAGEG